MISIADYFGEWQFSPDANDSVVANAETFLPKVNALLLRIQSDASSAAGAALWALFVWAKDHVK
jgi:hypothetical protein